MVKSNLLFLLIKSMTSHEKRYFKIDITKYQSNGNKSYLRLFDAIDGQEIYDEKIIRKKFKDDPYFKRLSDVKLYLQHQIMKSLRNFHDGSSHDIRLNNYLTEIELLYNKGLFKNCINTVGKARLYAEKYEKLPQLLKITDWEIKVVDKTNALHDIEPVKQAIKNAREVADKHKDIMELKRIYLESQAIFYHPGYTITADEIAKFDKVLQHPLMQKEVGSFEGEMVRLILKIDSAQVKRDFMATYSEMQRLARLYELYPNVSQEYYNVFFYLLTVLANDSIVAKKYKMTGLIIEQMKSIEARQPHQLAFMNKVRLLSVETSFLMQQGEHRKGLSFIPKINELLATGGKEPELMEQLYLDDLFSEVYFKNNDFKNAQYYIQKIINYKVDIRLDIQISARITNLILQYEQGEYDHLGYVLRSTYRYLMKRQQLYEPGKIILDFLRRALNFSSEKEILKGFEELRQQILPFTDTPVCSGIDLIKWIDSKLQKRDLGEIYKERYLAVLAHEEAEEQPNGAVQVNEVKIPFKTSKVKL